MSTVTHLDLRPGPRTFRGVTREGYHPSGLVLNVAVTPGQSVRLWGTCSNNREGQPRPFDRTFSIGEHAEYDSYNLIYDGPIVAIGAKTVAIDSSSTGHPIRRLTNQGLAPIIARRAREVALAENLDGQPESAYLKLAQKHKNNWRGVLEAIQDGAMLQGGAA